MFGPAHQLVRARAQQGPGPDRPGPSGVVWLALAAALAAAVVAGRRSRAVR